MRLVPDDRAGGVCRGTVRHDVLASTAGKGMKGLMMGLMAGLAMAGLVEAGPMKAAAAYESTGTESTQRASTAPAPASASSIDVAKTTPPKGTESPCMLDGVPNAARCGIVQRPLDPARSDGPAIDIHYAVLPALARLPKPVPIFFLAGGPGQSAIDLAGPVSVRLARLLMHHDVVLVDQRGTGRSAPLQCDEDGPLDRPLAELIDPAQQLAQLRDCRRRLQALPWGDLRQYTTPIAMADLDAVRARVGAQRIDLVGGSYGTRAALEYLRQFPARVHRAVLDGVAPPDEPLPSTFGPDARRALQALFDACAQDASCRDRHPALAQQWQKLLDGLPRAVTVTHPQTGRPASLRMTAEIVVGLARAPLYAPALAAALPYAIDEAVAGRWEPLIGLGFALGGGGDDGIAVGMHYAVMCAEDVPRLKASASAGTGGPGRPDGPVLAGFDALGEQTYLAACADWPAGDVPAAYYEIPPTTVPVLLTSGAADPVTPPANAAHVAAALGPQSRQIVAPNTGHGVMSLPCVQETIHDFLNAEDDSTALAVSLDCAAEVPRPPAFLPPGASGERAAPGLPPPAARQPPMAGQGSAR